MLFELAPEQFYNQYLNANINYSLSNNIGVGISSYNNPYGLKILIDSITQHTDLSRTTIFIIDDGSTDPKVKEYLESLTEDFVIIYDLPHIGPGNNILRLLKCLQRFNYAILLDDSTEIICDGWEFKCCRELEDRYRLHLIDNVDRLTIAVVDNKTITDELLAKPLKYHGYINHLKTLQQIAEFDISDCIISQSAWIESPEPDLTHIDYNNIPSISYVVPIRNVGRTGAIRTVISNIRGQLYPIIDINLVEHDSEQRMIFDRVTPIRTTFHRSNKLFNKAIACNIGVSTAVFDKIIIHDADMVIPQRYTETIHDILSTHDACHLGRSVYYLDVSTTNILNEISDLSIYDAQEIIIKQMQPEKVIRYFEGGSIAAHADTYWSVGGFDENFEGYGIEDTDFYERLMMHSYDWYRAGIFDFAHLWHPRDFHWYTQHEINADRMRAFAQENSYDRINRLREYNSKYLSG